MDGLGRVGRVCRSEGWVGDLAVRDCEAGGVGLGWCFLGGGVYGVFGGVGTFVEGVRGVMVSGCEELRALGCVDVVLCLYGCLFIE